MATFSAQKIGNTKRPIKDQCLLNIALSKTVSRRIPAAILLNKDCNSLQQNKTEQKYLPILKTPANYEPSTELENLHLILRS